MQNPIRPVPAPREPSIFGAMWRYRWVVVLTVLLTLAVAVLYDLTRNRTYVAEASLILQPPSSAGSGVGLGAQEAARYTVDQLTILRSPALAQKALAQTAGQVPGSGLTKRDFRNADLVSTGDSNVISIRFSADNPRVAAAAANAIGESYEGIRRSQVATGSSRAVQRTDEEIGAINKRLGAISTELAGLQTAPADDSRITTLSQEQKTLLDQRATLLQQRSQLSAAARAPGPVSIFIPVDLPVPQAPSNLVRLLAVAAFLGLLLGAAIAYGLAMRRRTFADAAEIELVVHAPLLGEIPDFSSPRRSTVPEPTPQATEAFRVVASAIASRAERTHATTFVVVSALRNEGKTTVTANTAITAALEGARVLVVDADPRRHGLTTLLESSAAGPLIARAERLNERLVRMVSLPNATLDLLSMTGPPSVNSWRSDAVRKFFQDMREAYDLVLIDTPDLLSASEASAVALHAEGAVIVVPEGAGIAEVTEVVSRLHVVGLEPIGYVHNLARTATRRTDRNSSGVATTHE